MNNISESQIISQVLETMYLNGIRPKHDINFDMDGKIHRFSTDKDSYGEKSGAYVIHSEGCPRWSIQDFRKGEMLNFQFDFDALTKEERLEYKKRSEPINYEQQQAKKAEAEKLQKEQEKQARELAISEYSNPKSSAISPYEHPYFKAKGIERTKQPSLVYRTCLVYRGQQNLIHHHVFAIKAKKEAGDICNVGELLIPLLNAENGEFQTLQHISNKPDNDGKFSRGFYKNIPVKGACADLVPYTTLNGNIDKIFICEGVATGLSFLELTENKYPVFAAMSATNMINVAQGLKKYYSGIRYENLKIIIAADNDNAGITAAKKTIEAGYADGFITPPINGMDYNDYFNYLKGEK